MSGVDPKGRSYGLIEISDLQRLLILAEQDREAFFEAHPQWRKSYGGRVLAVALCQGAALHYLDGKTGINDFDVYTFYRANPRKEWYAKRIKSYDLGDAKFGRSVDRPDFVGRRVDCLARGIAVRGDEEVRAALRRYLMEARTETARLLSAKAVVLLEPHCGEIIWPAPSSSGEDYREGQSAGGIFTPCASPGRASGSSSRHAPSMPAPNTRTKQVKVSNE